MPEPIDPTHCSGFQWDEGNADKNWHTHRVSQGECEQVFFNQPRVVRRDVEHAATEPRFYLLGLTNTGRPLLVVLTVRGDQIRVISARDMTRKERSAHERS